MNNVSYCSSPSSVPIASCPLIQLRGDLYCKGDFILHLDSDSVLFETITYDHMFHMGKPVLPFRRYREEEEGGEFPDYGE